MVESARFDRFLPPQTHQLLLQYLPEGSDWYEMRTAGGRVVSFTCESWDEALSNAKCLRKVMQNTSLYHCWIEARELREDKIY
jgi:hypothetical protein